MDSTKSVKEAEKRDIGEVKSAITTGRSQFLSKNDKAKYCIICLDT